MSHYIDNLLRDFPELSIDNRMLPRYYRTVSLGRNKRLHIYKISPWRITCKIVFLNKEGEPEISVLLKSLYTPDNWSFNRRIQFIKNHVFSETLHGFAEMGVNPWKAMP